MLVRISWLNSESASWQTHSPIESKMPRGIRSGSSCVCGCGSPLGHENITGYAWKCFRKTPEGRARGAKNEKTYLAKPENKPKKRSWGASNEANRRAKKKDFFVEEVDRLKVWERDRGVCHICKRTCDPENWHLDHVTPIARGGQHSYANVAVSHPFCNMSKGAKLMVECSES